MMTINNVSVNVNAASSLLTQYLAEVKKIAEKVNLSVEDVDMIIRLNRNNLRFQEVVQLGCIFDEKNKPALVEEVHVTKNVFDLEYIASHKEAYEMIDVNKPVCLDNVKVYKANTYNMFKMVLTGLYKIGVKEVHYRYWCQSSEDIDSLAKQSVMTVTESKRSEEQESRYSYYNTAKNANQVSTPEEPKKGKYMSASNMASLEASAPARVSNNGTIKAAAKRLAAVRANKSVPVIPVKKEEPVNTDADSNFIVPSFDEMMGFCSGSVSTYIEKNGEMVADVDDGKDSEELTEAADEGEDIIPVLDAVIGR